MLRTVFLAGASGAVGRPLSLQLVAAGFRVVGTTRVPAKVAALRALGIEPVVLDVFDAPALSRAVSEARPEVVFHQLTDLPPALDPARMGGALERNARLREEGTRNLVAAAVAAGARRLVAQSLAFVYAAGPRPWREDAPLLPASDPAMGRTVEGVLSLERQVLGAPLQGIVLRYGRLYGPGTGFDAPHRMPLHVEAAARAALLAIDRGSPGVYNVAEPDGDVAIEKAARDLGWEPRFRSGP
ncbi:MAG: NAD(P)-dependent oxidoreductase [Anaeromyxobacteraceae bacterium]